MFNTIWSLQLPSNLRALGKKLPCQWQEIPQRIRISIEEEICRVVEQHCKIREWEIFEEPQIVEKDATRCNEAVLDTIGTSVSVYSTKEPAGEVLAAFVMLEEGEGVRFWELLNQTTIQIQSATPDTISEILSDRVREA